MRIVSLELKNFRCFAAARYDFLQPITLIEGQNGSGKTSIVEALAYASTLKSFRTSITDDMIAAGRAASDSTLFIKLVVEDQGLEHILQLGYGQKKRSVKINGKKITHYKELVDHYRVVTMREDDILIVTGYPEQRRDFLDTALMQQDPGYAKIIRSYRATLKQRNALLAQTQGSTPLNQESYRLWTERLLVSAQEVRMLRTAYLGELTQEANQLIALYFPEIPALQLSYQIDDNFSNSLEEIMYTYQERERAARRTLFGPHLDDIAIIYAGSHGLAKKYASRGQQKLIALLMKLAQVLLLKRSSICLLDDFMTDFDDKRLIALINLLIKSQAHLIFTVPVKNSPLMHHLKAYEYDLLEL